jgi:hypothetical protein
MTSPLSKLRMTSLTKHVTEIRKLAGTTISNIVEIGRRLTECKKLVGHGNWLTWLEREFGWSESSALRFMRVYELGKSVTVTDLNLSVATLYLLAAPSTPEKARTEIIKRAKSGETISPAQVRAIRQVDTPMLTIAKPCAPRRQRVFVNEDIGPASSGEVERLRARVGELENEKRRLETRIIGLESENAELRAQLPQGDGFDIPAWMRRDH